MKGFDGNLQIQCLCTLLKLVASKLSEVKYFTQQYYCKLWYLIIHNLSIDLRHDQSSRSFAFIGKDTSRHEVTSFTLKKLINEIK